MIMRNIYNQAVLSGPGAAPKSVVLDTEKYQGERLSLHSRWALAAPVAKSFTAANVSVLQNTIAIAAHGFATGLKVTASTLGTLPAPLAPAGQYFIIRDASNLNVVKLALTQADAIAGLAIDITDVGVGGSTLTPTDALAGASLSIYEGNIAGQLIKNDDFDQAISATGEALWKLQIDTRYIEIRFAITGGQLNIDSTVIVKG